MKVIYVTSAVLLSYSHVISQGSKSWVLISRVPPGTVAGAVTVAPTEPAYPKKD